MAHSILTYTGDGSTTQFAVNFTLGYLNRDHVKVRVAEETDGLGEPLYRPFTWINDGLIEVGGAVPALGESVVLTRTVSPDTPYHDWADDAIIDETTLDENQLQVIMLIHEVLDGRISTLGTDLSLGNNKITDLADPTDNTDAANKQYVDGLLTSNEGNVVAAEAAQAAAEAARDAAQVSETAAGNSETTALSAATTATNAAADALSRKNDADASATSAAASATTAASEATDAEAAKVATEAARDTANSAASTATSAASSAASAQGGAESARDTAVSAASSASGSAVSATNAANAAEAAYDDFDDRYLGPKATAPTVDNDGDPLVAGMLYFDLTLDAMRVRNSANTAWVSAGASDVLAYTVFNYTATAGQTVFSGNDLSGSPLSYTIGTLQTFVNGIYIQESEVTATTGNTATLPAGLREGDEVKFLAFTRFEIADAVNKTGDAMLGDLDMQGNRVDTPLLVNVPSINGGPLGGFRNKLINGDFSIWQRATTSSDSGYVTVDRWRSEYFGGTTAISSQQAFTLGQTDVPGEPEFFHRVAVTSVVAANSYALHYQKIEGVRTLAGKQCTLTFYAKADASKTISVGLSQNFGSGGSAQVTGIGTTKTNLTSTWARYDVVFTLPSISGKTLGDNNALWAEFWLDAGSDWNARTDTLGHQSGTFDFAHVSLVEGDATGEDDPFEMRHIGLEKLLCDRYTQKYQANGGGAYFRVCNGFWVSNTLAYGVLHLRAPLRGAASLITPTVSGFQVYAGGTGHALTNMYIDVNQSQSGSVNLGFAVGSGGVTGQGTEILHPSSGGYVLLDNEL